MGKWKTLSGDRLDSINDFVMDCVKANGGEKIVHVGTDSLQTGRFTQFVTVLVILTPMKGGRVAYTREVVPRITSLRERLNKEVWKSLGVAMDLPDSLDLTIHIDANPSEKHMSSKYLQELVGLVVGQGFKALWKPDSWAATHAADHVVRIKGKLPRNGAQLALKAGVPRRGRRSIRPASANS
jgi:predicted RNase H-related nuclease YkuK (DUF458 family)